MAIGALVFNPPTGSSKLDDALELHSQVTSP